MFEDQLRESMKSRQQPKDDIIYEDTYVCSNCGSSLFVHTTTQSKCMYCGKSCEVAVG